MQKNKVVVFDLDDTLYKEVLYLYSAYHEIATDVEAYGDREGIYSQMLAWWRQGENVFERLISTYRLPLTVGELLVRYRSHRPAIILDEMVRQTLSRLSGTCLLGLITDGRSVTQRHKVEALGLSAWMQSSDILISEETGNAKPSEEPFRYFMMRYPSCTYYYIADNPEKDFVAPNRLDWTTVCLLDDGRNIHRQDFTLPVDMLPQHRIENILEIKNII